MPVSRNRRKNAKPKKKGTKKNMSPKQIILTIAKDAKGLTKELENGLEHFNNLSWGEYAKEGDKVEVEKAIESVKEIIESTNAYVERAKEEVEATVARRKAGEIDKYDEHLQYLSMSQELQQHLEVNPITASAQLMNALQLVEDSHKPQVEAEEETEVKEEE